VRVAKGRPVHPGMASGLNSARLVQIKFVEDGKSLMAAGETAGPSTSLRYGRDDNFVAETNDCSVVSIPASTELSSRP